MNSTRAVDNSYVCPSVRDRGVAMNLFERGQKTNGVHTGTEPPVGSGQSPQNEKYAENLIECH